MDSKLKIAQIVPSLRPTGLVNVALDLTKLLRDKGHEVELFYFDEKEDAADVKGTKIDFGKKGEWSSFDIIHSHGLRPDVYVRRFHSTMPAKVTTIHNYAGNDLKHTYNQFTASLFVPIWRWARAKHDQRVVLSKDMMKYYSSSSSNSFCVIPNTRVISSAKNDHRIKEIENLKKGRKVIGSLSTVTSVKGLNQIIEFVFDHDDWIYVHVGGGDVASLKNEAIAKNVEDRCFFLGHIEKGWEYVHAFDVFAMPSLSEGFPLSLIEAVQLQVPIVASDIDVFKEIFEEDEISIFQLNNSSSFATAVQLAYSEADAKIKNALKKYEECYSPEVVVNKYIECYKTIQK